MELSVLLEIVLAFLANTLLLMGISVVYSLFPNSYDVRSNVRKASMGVVAGLIGISIITNHYDLAPGIIFDARTVAMLMSGMFLGTLATAIAALFMGVYRIYLGGVGAFVGVLWIVTSGALGLLWRHLRLKGNVFENRKIVWYELYLYGLFVQVIMVLLLLLLPYPKNIDTMKQVALPILFIYPIGTLLVSYVMLTQRYRYQQNQRTLESELQYRNLFNESQAMLFLLDPHTGKIEDANDAAVSTYGYSREKILSMYAKDLSTNSAEDIKSILLKTLEEKKSFIQVQHIREDGSLMDVEVFSGTVVINHKQYIYSTVIDVSKTLESKRLFLDADEKLKAIFLSAGEGLVVTDESGHITLINQKAMDIIELEKNIIGKKIYNIFRIHSTKNSTPFSKHVINAYRENITYESDGSYVIITFDDENKEKFVNFTISPINDDDNHNHGAILVIRDITIEKERQEEIRYISQHDYLTGLHNRYFFEEEMKRLDTQRQLPLTILLGDVNGLKLVNDTFSHLEGDNLLIEIANIFKKAVRQEDIIARWGGDEFVILLPQTSEEQALQVYNRIKDLCNKSMYETIKPSISVGIASKTNQTQDVFEVLKMAEARMYREKLFEGKSMRSNLVSTLEKTLTEKSYETEQHTKNMIQMAMDFGEILKLSKDEINTLTLLARLHDIGKVSVNNELLKKVEPLTLEDWEQIKIHPETGSRIVQAIPELKHLTESILYHHERYDGTGYPHSLKGEKIPLLSRAISLIDSFEVMTSGRIYKKAMTQDEAIEEIKACKGTQFDPKLADKFIEMLKK